MRNVFKRIGFNDRKTDVQTGRDPSAGAPPMNDDSDTTIEAIRTESEWQRAGAYSIRIHGMNRQHLIPLMLAVKGGYLSADRSVIINDIKNDPYNND